ncbi:hypothetical protein WT49_01575 [Burkholderia territorii]|nr:hypothetical protein WT49_01575 [Burkholderia territorii]KWE31619.1 hypothetical protein WT50_30755 [Burkholderia territorii]KWE44759.1 hypothetical protein WT51_20210 [Burkholderia territorii]
MQIAATYSRAVSTTDVDASDARVDHAMMKIECRHADSGCMTNHIRCERTIIDHFLKRVVFERHARLQGVHSSPRKPEQQRQHFGLRFATTEVCEANRHDKHEIDRSVSDMFEGCDVVL